MLTHYVHVVAITKKMVTFFQDRVLSSIQPTPLILSSCVVAQAATQATQAKGAMLNGLRAGHSFILSSTCCSH